MDDETEYIENERGKFRLRIWETNKGPELGYVKWDICIYSRALAWWWALETSGITTYEKALRMGRVRLHDWSETYEET